MGDEPKVNLLAYGRGMAFTIGQQLFRIIMCGIGASLLFTRAMPSWQTLRLSMYVGLSFWIWAAARNLWEMFSRLHRVAKDTGSGAAVRDELFRQSRETIEDVENMGLSSEELEEKYRIGDESDPLVNGEQNGWLLIDSPCFPDSIVLQVFTEGRTGYVVMGESELRTLAQNATDAADRLAQRTT